MVRAAAWTVKMMRKARKKTTMEGTGIMRVRTYPDLLQAALAKVNPYASEQASNMHKGPREFLKVATARGQELVLATATPPRRDTEEIALEMAASLARRIEAGDEEAAPLQAMLHMIMEVDMASNNLRKANAAAGAVAQAAAAKEREAEAEV